MADRSEELAIIVRVQDLGSKALRSINKELGGLGKGIRGAAGAATRGVGTAVGNIERLAAVGAGLATGAGVKMLQWAGDFEAQMHTINTVAGQTPGELKKTGTALRQVSKDTGIALDEITSGYYDLVSAGLKGARAQEALNDSVKLGIGGLATTGEAIDLISTAANAYELDVKGIATATDQFALAVADGKVTAAEIAASFADVASIAKTSGVGIDQIAASYAYLTAQGVPAAEVTTQMQRAIISLIAPTKDLEKAGKKLGVNWADEIRKKGLVPALDEIRQYSEKTGIPLQKLLGRVEAVKYVTQTTGPKLAGFTAELDKMGKAGGTAAAQMAERQQGLNFQLNRLKALAKDAGITIGSALLPKVTPLIERLNTFLSDHQADISRFGDQLAGAFEDAVEWSEKLDWDKIVDSLKSAGGLARDLVQAFLDAPSWLQQAVLTGWGLNKLTGGAVTDIFGSLGKGLVGQLAGQFVGRGSSPANPLWVASVNGGAGGLLGGIGGGGSLLGRLLTGAGGLALGIGGSALLGAGTQMGGPAGAGVGALGAAGMIGGGALALGPLGAILGSVLAVGQTYGDVTAKNSQLAQGIADSVQRQIAGGAKLEDLQTSLAAVETGIHDIESNPLNVLVAGDALDTLKQQRDALVQQISLSTIGNQAYADTRSETARVRMAVEDQGQATADALAPVMSGVLAGIGAMRNAEMHALIRELRGAKSDDAIKAVLKSVQSTVLEKGLGGSKGARTVVDELKKALKQTHDPELQQDIRRAIGKVEAKIPGREWRERQFRKADAIERSNKSNGQKIHELHQVEQAFTKAGFPNAAKLIRQRINAVKGSVDTLPPRIAAVMTGTEHHAGKSADDRSGSGSSGGSSSGGSSGGGHGGGGGGGKVSASGRIEFPDRPTEYIAGEAKREAVIVLRNPRRGLMSAAGARAVMVQIDAIHVHVSPRVTFGLRELQEKQSAQGRLGKVSASQGPA